MSDRARRRAAFVVATLALLAAPGTAAQGPPASPRPWLDWHTAETEHFVLHYPSEYRTWTLSLAERIEGVRDQVRRIVGFTAPQRVHVVVDDPSNAANGYAFVPLDAPTIVLWPTPPDPRQEIGNARIWQELLVTHEMAHVEHLSRPSRNKLQRFLGSLSPVPLGPITLKAPRWIFEGYATFVEGRITGSGRPNNAWRAAIIRQFALEGRMPTYSQLNATTGWEAGSFAYLVGSAYLEWLARRAGDSSVVALWRRMTAVTDRSFDSAFSGVYGEPPDVLYARFSAEVTADAVALERVLARDGTRVEGTLVQRLIRGTGDPAVSPDGRYVALTVRRKDAPSRLVVWKTADEPDTAAARQRAELVRRDPEDVPDRNIYPPPKREVIALVASDGAPYESPRWLADNKHLLVTRVTRLSDGTARSDLYLWSAEDGELARLTHGAAVRDADPSPEGRWAAAVRCASGWCDLVRVDLATGALRLLRAGSVTRNYYRPRISHVTGEIVVAEQGNDRWRIALVSPETGALRYADPDDGATRYDATFAPDGRTIIATSEGSGIANLERIDPSGRATAISSVTGAAVAPDVASDGAVWYLALHAAGYDLRRLTPDSAAHPAVASLVATLGDTASPVLPPRRAYSASDTSRRPARGNVSTEQPYGAGPSRFRIFPSSTSGVGGSSVQLSLVRSDPVGRLGVALTGSVGSAALPAGGALAITSRAHTIQLGASAWLSHEAPSRMLDSALRAGLDLARGGGALYAVRDYAGDGFDVTPTLAFLAEHQRAESFDPVTRSAAILRVRSEFRQRDEGTRYREELDVLGEVGRTFGGRYARHRSELVFGTAAGGDPLTTLRVAVGTLQAPSEGTHERFVVGGIASPLIDPMFDARRVDAPAYPLASATGSSFVSYRASVPVAGVELFYAGVSTDTFRSTLRSYGAELRQHVPLIAALGTPDVDALAGVARAVDAPARGAWRFYLTASLRP